MLLMMTVVFMKLFTSGQRIDVALCNQDGLSESVMSTAKAETEVVFRPVQVQIVWHGCENSLTSAFVIRLWKDRVPRTVGPASLDVMGKAFVAGPNGGTVADIYLPAIRATAEQHAADPGEVMGLVVAHELGHLLLGPGHTPDGVMQAVWGQKQIDAVRQRRLHFNKEGAERIRLAIGVRAAARTTDDDREEH